MMYQSSLYLDVKRNILLNLYENCKNVEKAVISKRVIFPQMPLDLAVKANSTAKKNILLNFYEYCKNVEKAVISIKDIFPQKL
jgi:hypothetical protein